MVIDIAIVLSFIIYSISVGLLYRKKASQNLVEYFLAGKSLKGWQAGASMAATQYAADTPLLITGLVATSGLFALWRLWIYAIAFLLMGFMLASAWRRSGVLTDAELTQIRYGGEGAFYLRILKAIHLGTFINCVVLAMVLIAAMRIAEPFLLWHDWLPASLIDLVASFLETLNFNLSTLDPDTKGVWIQSASNLISILCIITFTALYSSTGGLRSVVATDMVQLIIALSATGLYGWFLLDEIGGMQILSSKLHSLYGNASANSLLSVGPHDWSEISLTFLGVLGIQWFAQVNADGTGYLAQRTMACQTNRDAKTAAIFFTFIQIVLRSLLLLPVILALLILYPASEIPALGQNSEAFRIFREGTFALGIRDFLPPGARGLMLTGLLAALASTVDTHLNWGASYWTNDLYKKGLMEKVFGRNPSNKELVWVARISQILILIIALIVMQRLSSIQTAWHLSLLFGSGLGLVLILRWLWWRINLWSEISAGLCSLIFAPVLVFGFPELSEPARLLWMVALSTVVILTITLITKPENRELLSSFFTRVSPPGFWKDSDAQVRFFFLLTSTLLAGLSVFSTLVGGIYIILNPGGRAGYLWIVFGILLIPVWMRWGFKN